MITEKKTRKVNESLFDFKTAGHRIFEHKGHKFAQHQAFERSYADGSKACGKLAFSTPVPLSDDYPTKYAFWGGAILTDIEIIAALKPFAGARLVA